MTLLLEAFHEGNYRRVRYISFFLLISLIPFLMHMPGFLLLIGMAVITISSYLEMSLYDTHRNENNTG